MARRFYDFFAAKNRFLGAIGAKSTYGGADLKLPPTPTQRQSLTSDYAPVERRPPPMEPREGLNT